VSDAIPLAPLWHITVTVSGDPTDAGRLRAGLLRLTQERPFFLLARYACDRAELRYWEEARDLDDAAALALRLWGEHRTTSGLPPWHVVGLEVIDRDTFQRRAASGGGAEPLSPVRAAGEVIPF
jgi:hypothetical protein